MRAGLLGLMLVGCGWSTPPAPVVDPGSPAAKAPVVQRVGKGRKVAVTLAKDGLQPARVEANANEPLTLVFERDGDGCGGEVVFPGTGARTAVPAGEAVEVPVTAPASGEVVFTCGAASGVVAVAGG